MIPLILLTVQETSLSKVPLDINNMPIIIEETDSEESDDVLYFLKNVEGNQDIIIEEIASGKVVDETVYATDGVNIREYFGTESEKISSLSYGQSIKRIAIYDNGWSKVIYDKDDTEITGYIYSDYLSTETPLETSVKESDASNSNSTGSYIGTFTAYHYCTCSLCCGNSNGITASGTKATPGRTIAVDSSVIPLGSKVVINGQIYVAEDTGGGINGYKIDILCSSHSEALSKGVITVEIYYAN